MGHVAVSADVLRWALQRAGLAPDSVDEQLPGVSGWIAGTDQPTLRQLEDVARRTHTPLGFLLLEEPPEEALPIPYFRTLKDGSGNRPSINLLDVTSTMQRRQGWLSEYLAEQEHEPLKFVNSARVGDPSGVVARSMLAALDLGPGWAARLPSWEKALRFLREAMEAKGIVVAVSGIVGNDTHRPLDPKEFCGFVLVDERAPLVFVNGADYKARQMFTLAHELAHVFFGSSAAFDLREMLPSDSPVEQACNRAAAEFLVPDDEMREAWPSARSSPDPFQAIARRFKVSELVAARRALDLGLIDIDVFRAFYDRYLENARWKKARRSRRSPDPHKTRDLRLGRRFARAVVRATREGRLLYSEAYRLTGLHGSTFEQYATHLEPGRT